MAAPFRSVGGGHNPSYRLVCPHRAESDQRPDRGFDQVARGPRSTDDYLEDQLAAVEGEVAATLCAIIDRKTFPPSSDDRLVLACFVALQFLRTARIRGWLSELADAASQQRPHANAHLQLMLELLPKATNRLIAMRLVIVRYKRQRLLTCDRPVVRHSEPIDGSFPTGVGLLNADEVWLSVSRDVEVCFTGRVPRDAELPPNASGADWLNLLD